MSTVPIASLALQLLQSRSRFPDTMMVGDLRKIFAGELGKGSRCPLCTQFAQIYCRTLNRAMIMSLRWLVEATQGGKTSVDVQKYGPPWIHRGGRQHTALPYWDLARRVPSQSFAVPSTGLWYPTEKGVDFAYEKIRVPKKVLVYDGEVLGFDGVEVLAHEAMGTNFHYPSIFDVPADLIASYARRRP